MCYVIHSTITQKLFVTVHDPVGVVPGLVCGGWDETFWRRIATVRLRSAAFESRRSELHVRQASPVYSRTFYSVISFAGATSCSCRFLLSLFFLPSFAIEGWSVYSNAHHGSLLSAKHDDSSQRLEEISSEAVCEHSMSRCSTDKGLARSGWPATGQERSNWQRHALHANWD